MSRREVRGDCAERRQPQVGRESHGRANNNNNSNSNSNDTSNSDKDSNNTQ